MEEDEQINRLESLIRENRAPELTPRPETIHLLRSRLKRGDRSVVGMIASARIPAWSAIAAMIAIGLLVWISSGTSTRPEIVHEQVVKTDTIFVTRTDTIRIDRVIYKERATTKTILVREKEAGSSMKDKEELQELLVSGSD